MQSLLAEKKVKQGMPNKSFLIQDGKLRPLPDLEKKEEYRKERKKKRNGQKRKHLTQDPVQTI